MTQDLGTTNLWLAVIALVSLAEFLTMIAMGVAGFRLYRRATVLIQRAQADYVAPLTARVNVVVGEAHEVVRRVQHLEERARGMVAGVEDLAGRVTSVAQHAWPVVGTWRAVAAALGALRHPEQAPASMRAVARRSA